MDHFLMIDFEFLIVKKGKFEESLVKVEVEKLERDEKILVFDDYY